MRALARSDFTPWSLSEAVVADFVRKGAYLFDEPLDPDACADLLGEIRATRRFDESLFLSEDEFARSPQAADGEARSGRNLLGALEPRLRFVERAPQVVEALWTLLGPDYAVLDRKLVCELPARALPEWVRRRRQGDPRETLAAYLRPEYRDLAYVHGCDFHQDLAADEDRPADFVTLCVYLHGVTEADAPVHLLEGSHRMGASPFPHDLKRTGPDGWRYRNGDQGDMFVTRRVLTGEAGFAALWHACALHGAPPCEGGEARIALRYLFARGAAAAAGVDTVNATLAGPLRLSEAGEASAQLVAASRWNVIQTP